MSSVADFDVEDFESRDRGKEKNYVRFYIKAKEDPEKSASEGRPIYVDREYIEIRAPGNQTNIVDRPVSDKDKQDYRRAYAMFKAGDAEQVIGTPLSEVTWITRSQVEELSYWRVRTLEQLAAVGDDVCSRHPGLTTLKNKAIQFVAKSEANAPFIALHEKNKKLEEEMAAMKQAMEEQTAIIRSLQSAQQGKVAK